MRVLVVDDENALCDRLVDTLKFEGIDAAAARNGLSAKRLLEQETFGVVVTDLNMPGMNGMALLQWIREERPTIPVMMMSAYGEVAEAVEAMKTGAFDYLVKPFELEEFLIRVRHLLEYRQHQKPLQEGAHAQADAGWIGDSPKMHAIMRLVQKIAPSLSTVLISGESGTGKEVVARMIHALSNRLQGPFMAINIGGVPGNLLESELFGYEKGAFTGATTRKIGLFELASFGTLFLDEIGDMPAHLQVKLLRVLQERKIQRLGGTQSIPIDVRILAATNKVLSEEIRRGMFREDLYYRLNVIQIDLPPLRERASDIPLLAGHLLQKLNTSMGKTVRRITPDAVNALQHYQFPGNVRELENMLERAMLLTETDTIRLQDIGLTPRVANPAPRRGTLADLEQQAIADALLRWEGNRTKASEELGITRQTLLKKIKDYGLENQS